MSETIDEGFKSEDWSSDMGRKWLSNLARFEGMIAPIGAALIEHAGFKPGEHVIDIGCGGGATTITIGRCVSPGGSVTGLDISQDLIDAAGIRASQGTQSRVYWVCADAATVMPTAAPFDRLVSRFGTMFFADPPAAFRNLRAMLKAGGRIDLAVWAPPAENQWISTVMAAIGKHVTLPRPDPRAPGPFALADTGYLTELLIQGGFGDIRIEPCVRDLPIGGPGASPEEAATLLATTMSFAAAIEAAGPEKQADVFAEIVAALAPYHVPGKGNLLGGKAWLVTATAL